MRYVEQRKHDKGISLAEVVFSLGLIAISVIAIISLVGQNVELGKSQEYNYIAINIAKSRIDEIRQARRDFSFDVITSKYTESSWTSVDFYGEEDPDGVFERKTEITVPSGQSNLKHIKVSVRYKITGAISPMLIEIDTYVSPYF